MKLLFFFSGFSLAVAIAFGSILSVSRQIVGMGRTLLRRYFPPLPR